MTKRVSVRLTESELTLLDGLIEGGRFESRSDALRAGLARLIDEDRELAIEAAYRRGYAEHPQEDWIGKVGLAELEAFHRSDQR